MRWTSGTIWRRTRLQARTARFVHMCCCGRSDECTVQDFINLITSGNLPPPSQHWFRRRATLVWGGAGIVLAQITRERGSSASWLPRAVLAASAASVGLLCSLKQMVSEVLYRYIAAAALLSCCVDRRWPTRHSAQCNVWWLVCFWFPSCRRFTARPNCTA